MIIETISSILDGGIAYVLTVAAIGVAALLVAFLDWQERHRNNRRMP